MLFNVTITSLSEDQVVIGGLVFGSKGFGLNVDLDEKQCAEVRAAMAAGKVSAVGLPPAPVKADEPKKDGKK